jgi:pimeloyl-ACP methyl ester carboxylesterase
VLTYTSCATRRALLSSRVFACPSKTASSIYITLQIKAQNKHHDFSSKSYSSLLKGLDVNTVPAEDDGHPLAVYTIAKGSCSEESMQQERTPVLLLHGRTWSSVPVYHLVGGSQNTQADGCSEEQGESRSLIEALFQTQKIQPYAMDFRGFGGTPKDDSGFVEPLRCVKDVVSVLHWIQSNHSDAAAEVSKPALLGWSHGALIAQIAAQRHPDTMSKLIL